MTTTTRKFGPKELVQSRSGFTGRVSASYKEDGVVQYAVTEVGTGASKTFAEKELHKVSLG